MSTNKTKQDVYTAPVIKKGKYKVYNGTDYEIVHLETTSDQVIESDAKKFVSQTEKNTWNSKADGSHKHDERYYQKTETFTQAEITTKLDEKAAKTHGHSATDIATDNNKMFVSKAEKDRWNDTYTKAEINSTVGTINSTITANKADADGKISKVETDYKAADNLIKTSVTTVQTNLDKAVEDLTSLINGGGSANEALAARVEKIEKTDLPAVRTSVSALDTRVSGQITDLDENKADKTQVAADIETAKTALEGRINVKADKTYVDTELGKKANQETTYTKTEVDTKLGLKADTTYVDTELAKKASTSTMNTELAKKADKSTTDAELAKKANITYVDDQLATKAALSHTHTASQVTGLGTAATKNIGTSNGQIPVLDANGKLADSVIPKIAINQVYTVDTIDKAMALTVKIGDIVFINPTGTLYDTIVDTFKVDTKTVSKSKRATKCITYGSPEQILSDEYMGYMAQGKMTYLVVDPAATKFEDRFKPLQSMGDTISAGEVQAALNLKLDKTEFNTFKTSNTAAIDTKANKTDVYTKTESNNLLNNKVDKVSGKGLSTNDFTTALKSKLDGIAANANNYVHPTGDGNLHVPSNGTTNNNKVLMSGATAGALSWVGLTTSHIATSSSARFITDAERTAWNNKADQNHTHDQYRLISDSLSATQTRTEIGKLKTIVSATAPAAGAQIAGAVWIETV